MFNEITFMRDKARNKAVLYLKKFPVRILMSGFMKILGKNVLKES